jgi:electron transfer flavoprotein alpha subunit
MAKVFVLVEHRRGSIREATFECVTLARELQTAAGLEPAAVVIGSGVAPFAETLAADRPETIVVDDPSLEHFRFETYAAVLRDLIERETPLLVIAPHSAFGMELVPRLSAELARPCATDCVAVGMDGGALAATRSVYNGKIDERLAFAPAGGYFATVRAGSYAPADPAGTGAIRAHACPAPPAAWRTEHRGYRETAAGAVDITQAPLLLAIGRGIKDAENIPKAQALADRLGAVLACSRPVVDKKWLGKERQVGTSGRTVKPKVYLALGISGAFQHIAGIKGPGVFIAVNRDPKAPVFRAADFGVVEDMFKIIDALAEKLGAK